MRDAKTAELKRQIGQVSNIETSLNYNFNSSVPWGNLLMMTKAINDDHIFEDVATYELYGAQ